MSKRERCLWLMNHKTLRAFEVPMLINMGFEVFCPKMFPYDEGNLSADVTYEYDVTLSIPEDVLERMNQENFYGSVSSQTMELLNQYFDIVFTGFFPEQLKMVVEGFKGVIVMQPFGLSNGLTYTQIISDTLGYNFLNKIEELGERFIFGQAYENIAGIECRILKNRAMYLPLGLKNAYVKDEWEGGDKRILFVCPRINTSPYFKNIYLNFKKDFAGFHYLVGGAQPIEVQDDSSVAGYMPGEQYEYCMKHLYVMFYHSREERHVHYHPFEAVKNGMPLIFMSGGILDSLGGKGLPGRCETIREARKKIARIMSGDEKFIQKIKKDQGILLERFTYEYCYEKWSQNLDDIRKQIEETKRLKASAQVTKKKKLAVLLSEGYLGGVLDVAYRLLKSLQQGAEENNANLEIIFGYLDHKNFTEDMFDKFRDMGIRIRKFNWKYLTAEDINNVFKIQKYDFLAENKVYCTADDGINFFTDCDHILFIIDRVPACFFSTIPYSVIVQDYIQRYLPGLMDRNLENNIFSLQRDADAVFVTTIPAMEDSIQYGGIKKEKIKLMPLLFDRVEADRVKDHKEKYFLWSTNIGEHKNHRVLLKALEEYYDNGGKLKCYMTGVNTELFDIKKKPKFNIEYTKKIRNIIMHSKNLSSNLIIKGNMNKKEYFNLLAGARFLVHPGFTDNGNMSSVDAAFLGVPSISSDYPAMRYYEKVMGLKIRFVNPFDHEAWAEMLLKSEKDCEEWSKQLPTEQEMDQFSISHMYDKIYDTITEVIGI